jgi:hypothetical protein
VVQRYRIQAAAAAMREGVEKEDGGVGARRARRWWAVAAHEGREREEEGPRLGLAVEKMGGIREEADGGG